jgi:hypothetical protein
VALRQGVFAGYSESSDFTKLREISATFDFGGDLARKLTRSTGARFSLAARNIKTWTDWTGSDPEAFIASNADVPSAVFTPAAPFYVMARLNLTY